MIVPDLVVFFGRISLKSFIAFYGWYVVCKYAKGMIWQSNIDF